MWSHDFSLKHFLVMNSLFDLPTWTQAIKFMKFKFGNMDTNLKVYEVQVWQPGHKP